MLCTVGRDVANTSAFKALQAAPALDTVHLALGRRDTLVRIIILTDMGGVDVAVNGSGCKSGARVRDVGRRVGDWGYFTQTRRFGKN